MLERRSAPTERPISKEAIRIPEINGFRGIAILAVIFHHLFSAPIGDINPSFHGLHFAFIYRSGWLGVNLFFLLSGFVLYLPYATGQRTLRNGSDWLGFYKHRALRLFPAFYLVAFATMALSGRAPWGDAKQSLETIGLATWTFPFMPSVFSPPTNWALWSIGTEVLFSAAFPLVCLACVRFGALRTLVVCIVFSLSIRLLAHSTDPTKPITWLADGLMIGRLDEFAWGMWLAELYASGRLWKRPVLMIVVGVVILAPTLFGFNLATHGALSPIALSPLTTALDIGMALMVAAALCTRSIYSRALCLKPLLVAGMACYSLYLWHYPILVALRLHIDPWNVSTLAVFFVLLFTLSGLTYRYVEFRAAPDWRKLFLLA